MKTVLTPQIRPSGLHDRPFPGTTLLSAALAATLVILFGLGSPSEATAQAPDEFLDPPRVHVGGHGVLAQPMGEFDEYVSFGGGIGGFLKVDLDRAGLIGFRVDFTAMTYGQETRRVCLVDPCLVGVDLVTSNNILLAELGPEIIVPLGDRVSLYGTGGGGFAYFATQSRVENQDGETIASDDNFSDFGFAWKAGGGLRVGLTRGDTPVALDVGVDYRGNGRREYLTAGDITVRPDDSLEFNVRRSDADFLLWKIGVSVGLRSN